MKFIKKAVKPAPADGAPRQQQRNTYGDHIKRRAFELYVEVDFTNKYNRRYSVDAIAKQLHKEFKQEAAALTGSNIRWWVTSYGWDNYHNRLLDKARQAASDIAEQEDLYYESVANTEINFTRIEQLNKLLDRKTYYAEQVDKMAPLAASMIVDMFRINQAHFANLMRTHQGTWTYDCDRFGTRKQLFDMWFAGTTKLMEIYNMVPPKRTLTKTNVTNTPEGQEITFDSTTGGGVALPDANYELILKLFGLEQTKGGFGHELTGPDNADFPSSPGSQPIVNAGEAGPDKKSSGH